MKYQGLLAALSGAPLGTRGHWGNKAEQIEYPLSITEPLQGQGKGKSNKQKIIKKFSENTCFLFF